MKKKAVDIIKRIDEKNNGDHSTESIFYHTIEEIGEISRELYNMKSGRAKIDKKNLALEIADVYLLLAQLSENFGIDLTKAVKDKINELERIAEQ
ncbi:MAG: hypothetical protein JW754_04200 [Candidatus Aenigmarchaeota archaeon]|nr:hypothetical protein [Candidatus Aenigmarchaeota archaeon]